MVKISPLPRRSNRLEVRLSRIANRQDQDEVGRKPHVLLQNLPTEILDLIIGQIRIHDMATMALTNKSMEGYIAPHLYRKMYTRIGSSQDTAGLVHLLQKRPQIVPAIHLLILDEYHPYHLRKLLAIKMPNLWCLLIQHKGAVPQNVSERQKRILNRGIVEQPGLRNREFPRRTIKGLAES